ncbi:MAG: putative sensor protein [Marmoricola sp.]|nr:putative sensor protein [Marmoricola sp.]
MNDDTTSSDTHPHFGRWTYDYATGSWSWSPEIIRMWDIALATESAIDDVLGRVHEDDRVETTRRVTSAVDDGVLLSGQARLTTDSRGERIFSFLGDVLRDDDGVPLRLEGYSIDVTDEVRLATRDAVDSATRHRRAIEQVKGALMVTYRVDEVTAFAILRKQSNESNVKIHDLAEHVSRAMSGGVPRPDGGATPMMEILAAVARKLRPERDARHAMQQEPEGLPEAQ